MTLDCGGGTDASGVHDVGGADAIGGTRSGYHGRLPGGKNENYRHRLKREFEDLINSPVSYTHLTLPTKRIV